MVGLIQRAGSLMAVAALSLTWASELRHRHLPQDLGLPEFAQVQIDRPAPCGVPVHFDRGQYVQQPGCSACMLRGSARLCMPAEGPKAPIAAPLIAVEPARAPRTSDPQSAPSSPRAPPQR